MNRATYKTGDMVIIKDFDSMMNEFGIDTEAGIKITPRFTAEMWHLCGKQVVIASKGESAHGDIYWVSDGTEEYKISEKAISGKKAGWITKDFLKTGMIVENRIGTRFFIFGDGMSGLNGYIKLSEYRETLTHLTVEEMDIVKVFQVPITADPIERLLMCNEVPIAERGEVKRISEAEAYEALVKHYGCDVEIISREE